MITLSRTAIIAGALLLTQGLATAEQSKPSMPASPQAAGGTIKASVEHALVVGDEELT